MSGDVVSFCDSCLSSLYSASAWLIGCALGAGAASMAIYAMVSPQERLKAMERKSADVRGRLARYDGDFSGGLVLVRMQLAVAVRRLGLSVGPALLAGLPVLAALAWIEDQSSAMVFLLLACLPALAIKLGLRIS